MKKTYLFDENAKLTDYARRKLRKINKSQQINNSELKQDVEEKPSDACPSIKTFLQHEEKDEVLSNDQLLSNDDNINTTQYPSLESKEKVDNDYNISAVDNLSDHEQIHINEPEHNSLNVNDQIDSGFTGLQMDNSIQSNEHVFLSDEELFSDSDNGLLDVLKSNRKTFEDLKNTEGFFEPLNASVNRSTAEILLMALQLSVAEQLSFTSIVNCMSFVNNICERNILPQTRYYLNEIFNIKSDTTFHCMCTNCTEYLGTFTEFKSYVNCSNCEKLIDVGNFSNSCFFITIDPPNAVSDYLSTYWEYYNSIKNKVHELNKISDIYDGKCYRSFRNNVKLNDNDLFVTGIFNTDGAPVFESSNYSIWPIYFMPNEIPIQSRFNSLIVVGLWFGKSKPEMSVFLEQFVNMFNKLSINGFRCTIKGKEYCIKLFPLLACVDTMARPSMNGTTYFNGFFGCDWCEQQGSHEEGSMRYCYLDIPAKQRTAEDTIVYAKEALENSRVIKGIKFPSPLLTLNNFNIIHGFCPDYMHCYLAGVGTQYTEYLISTLSDIEIKSIDDLMLQFKVPRQITRLARPLTERKYWNNREWENWILYYSIPILSIFLKIKQYLLHWSYLVEALYIGLEENITYEQLNKMNYFFNKFVSEAENLYSVKAMTYNTHQLLHLAKSIENWGPLWAHSTFAFESANGKLLKAVHSSKGVILQILRFINIIRTIQLLETEVYPCNFMIKHFCENLVSPAVKKAFNYNSTTYFGNPDTLDSNILQNFQLSDKTVMYHKIVKDGCLYTSSKKIRKRSCNHYAEVTNNRFIEILGFLLDVDNSIELVKCYFLATRRNKYGNNVREIVRVSKKKEIVELSQMLKPCVYIDNGKIQFIIPVPNKIHY